LSQQIFRRQNKFFFVKLIFMNAMERKNSQ